MPFRKEPFGQQFPEPSFYFLHILSVTKPKPVHGDHDGSTFTNLTCFVRSFSAILKFTTSPGALRVFGSIYSLKILPCSNDERRAIDQLSHVLYFSAYFTNKVIFFH
jgi:hypothetical protein